MRNTIMDAGTIVLVLLVLFAGLMALATFLSVAPGVPNTPEVAMLISKALEWAAASFFAMLTALGIQRGRRGGDDDNGK